MEKQRYKIKRKFNLIKNKYKKIYTVKNNLKNNPTFK